MHAWIERAAAIVEVVGVAVMLLGGLVTVAFVARSAFDGKRGETLYRELRAGIGRSILLGLELLVAADIIQTILIRPTLEGAGALAIIVLVRTFLSFSLETEIEGRPPWRRNPPAEARR